MLHKGCTIRMGGGGGVADIMVIVEDGVDVDAELRMDKDECKMTPVFRAANTGHTKAVQCLVQNGANYEIATATGGLRPIHAAAKQGNKDTIE